MASSADSLKSLTLSSASSSGSSGSSGSVDIPELVDVPPEGKYIKSGTYGDVYEVANDPKKIMKVFDFDGVDYDVKQEALDNLAQEVTIQQKLFEKVPGSCPEIHSFGRVPGEDRYIVVMEKLEADARALLLPKPNQPAPKDELVLDYLEQIAKILKDAEPFGFNHRDLKSDNIMYKNVAGRDPTTGKLKMKKKYLLIDFGFSCAKFDGVDYAGYLYFAPGIKCFRKSRDLALLVFELFHLKVSADIKKFAQLVLTFDYKGKKCDMSQGCLPDFDGDWVRAYKFLDKDEVENPNTTPDGLLRAIEVYRKGGVKACEKGFVLDPTKNACVRDPGPPAAAVAAAAAAGAGPAPSPGDAGLLADVYGPNLNTPGGGRRRRKTLRPKRRKLRHTEKRKGK